MARRTPSLLPAVAVGAMILVGSAGVAWAVGRPKRPEDWLNEQDEPDIEDEGAQPSSEGEAPRSFEGQRLTDRTEAKPEELVEYDGKRLHRDAAAAMRRMVADARKDGIEAPLLKVVSGYRSVKSQNALWERALTKYRAKLRNQGKEPSEAEVIAEARRWVAPPGNSTHQTGKAVDLELGTPIRSEVAEAARKTRAWIWLDKNANRYGWAPYKREPWHWEYLGAPQ